MVSFAQSLAPYILKINGRLADYINWRMPEKDYQMDRNTKYVSPELKSSNDFLIVAAAVVFASLLLQLIVTTTLIGTLWQYLVDFLYIVCFYLIWVGISSRIINSRAVAKARKSEQVALEIRTMPMIKELADDLLTKVSKKNPAYDQADDLLWQIFEAVKLGIHIDQVNTLLLGMNDILHVVYLPKLEISVAGTRASEILTLYYPSYKDSTQTVSRDFELR